MIGAYFGNRLPGTLLGLRVILDPSEVGIPAGYRWGYILTPDGNDATVVTEVFDCGPFSEELLRDGGSWNGTNSVSESMTASLERLETISTESGRCGSVSMERSSGHSC